MDRLCRPMITLHYLKLQNLLAINEPGETNTICKLVLLVESITNRLIHFHIDCCFQCGALHSHGVNALEGKRMRTCRAVASLTFRMATLTFEIDPSSTTAEDASLKLPSLLSNDASSLGTVSTMSKTTAILLEYLAPKSFEPWSLSLLPYLA